MENRIQLPYISEIQITGLYGLATIDWKLRRGVNILSGINGSGKSTIVESVCALFENESYTKNPFKPIDKVDVIFENGQKVSSEDKRSLKKEYNIDIVSTFDSNLKMQEAVQKLSDNQVRSDLDWELYRLQRRYLTYQLSLGKEAINILLSKEPNEGLKALMDRKSLFFDMVDELFKETGKQIVRESDELKFKYRNIQLSPYQLSSGEKQMMMILTTVLTQNNAPYIMIMDEPEISLHFDWQKNLIQNIMTLNPNLQLILTTHSPAVIMEGWMDKVTDVSELIVNS